MDAATNFQFPSTYQAQSSVDPSSQEPPFELKTNCRSVFGTIGAVAGIAAGVTAGIFLGMVVTPIIAIPVLTIAAAVLGFGAGVVGYTAGENADIAIAERKVDTTSPNNPKVVSIVNRCISDAIQETVMELPKLGKRVATGIGETVLELGESAANFYQRHLKGKSLDDAYEEYVLRMDPRRNQPDNR